MNIDEIMSEWKTDSEIDVTELADESIKIAKLHQKYYEYLIKEKLLFIQLIQLIQHKSTEYFYRRQNSFTCDRICICT